MKLFKIMMLFLVGAFAMSSAAGQANASLNILTQNSGIVNEGGIGFIQVSVGNTGPTSNINGYKVKVQISVPSTIVNISVANTVLPAGWTVTSSNAGVINLSNGTDVIPVNDVRNILVAVQGITIGGPLTVAGSISFSNGNAPGTAPGTLPGDNTADNLSQSTVQVIAAPACTISAASASAGTIACSGGSTTLTVSATGGVAPLEYSIGGAYQSGNTFTVPAGSYTATVREAGNTACNATATAVIVSQPTALTAAGSAGAIACFGGSTSVVVSATGGTAPYTGTGTFTVSAGSYSFTVTDANGCTAVAAGSVAQPAALVASAAVTTPIATFGGNGTITVSATGGTPAYTGTGAQVRPAGSYTFTVTDANGCTATSPSVTLSNPTPCVIAVTATTGSIACNGGTTTLTAAATGAVGTVEYSLNGGAFQSSNTFTVVAGAYTVTAREVSRTSCSATSTTVTVAQPAALVASGSFTPICFGGTSTVTISATGGTAPYTGAGTFSQAAGTQSYTVTDANGCTTTTSVTVTQAAQVATPVITSVNNGNNTFTLTATGYTGSLLWSTNETTASILVAAAGTYTVTQTIGACTSAAASQTVTLGNAIADPAVGQIYFTNLSDATQSANSLLFTQNYRLKLPVYNLNQFTSIPSSAINFKVDLGTRLQLDPAYNLATAPLSQYFSFAVATVAGHQIITGTQIAEIPADFADIAVFEVSGSLSCTSTIASDIVITNSSASLSDEDLNNNHATLQYTLPVTVSASPVNVTCFGAANGNITVVASPGTTIVITNAANTVVTAPFAPGTYTVTANATGDAPLSNTCSNSTTVTISQPTQVTITVSGTTAAICNGGNTGTITVTSAGGTPGYTYTIAGPAVNTTGASSGVFTGLTAGTYSVTTTDANGCSATATATVAQPSGTSTDLALGSDITGSMFAVNGTAQTIVYNISEIAGNPAVGDTLRITKVAGFDITFNDALTSTVVTPTTYTLSNPDWKIDNSNPAFVSIIKKAAGGLAGPGTISCGQTEYISITLTRNTTNISTFPLSARIRKANGELNLSNNFNSIIFTAE